MTNWIALSEDLAGAGVDVVAELDLGGLTTYRVGGSARVGVRVASMGELAAVAAVLQGRDVATLVVGRGSNLLVADRGFEGVALLLGEPFAAADVEGTTVRAGAGASLPVLARQTVRSGLTGFEWAVGVPGSVGGAVRMNAGGHGSDMAANLVSVRIVDLRTGEEAPVGVAELDLSYRHSSVAAHQVVVSAELALDEGDPARGEEELGEIVRWRRDNQPGGQNAGSVFTNPPDDAAGRLVEAAGAKGLRIGSAQVSPKHANFIQADLGGSADDVYALMVEVRRRVREDSGIDLRAETCLVGFENVAGDVDAPAPDETNTRANGEELQ